MRSFVSLAMAFGLTTVAVVVGCNGGADTSLGYSGQDDSQTPPPATSTQSTCTNAAPLEKLADPTTLPECAPACGGAHCVPGDKVPASSQGSFATCTGGYCLPDALIISGGAKPPACNSLNNSAGVCLSICVPLVAANKDLLPTASCGADERCAPCINPNDGTNTGACDIGVQNNASCDADAGAAAADSGPAPDLTCPHVGAPVLDPSMLPACGGAGSAAHCLPASNTPMDLQSKLAACTGGFCVPDKLIESGGRFIPATCTSLGGNEGRCESKVLPAVASQTNLPQATCDQTELCVPCASPVDGTDTGACKTSCDPGPKSAPILFQSCCGNVGKCVPKVNLPSTSNLDGDGCQNNSLCVPTEILEVPFKPQTCHGSPTFADDYDGVCLSKCLDFGTFSDFVLDDSNCSGNRTCVPCKDGGKPTGAPGCPP